MMPTALKEFIPYCTYIPDYFKKYLPSVKHGSSKTKSSYKTGVKCLINYWTETHGVSFKEFCFEDIDYDSFLDFRNNMLERGLSERSCNLYLSANKSYINYSASKNIVLQSMAYAINKVPPFHINAVHKSCIEDENALTVFLDSPPNTRNGIRDRTILNCLYDGAFRGSELTSILNGDICWDEEISVTIHGKGNKERRIWLTQETKDLMIQYRTLFHRDLDPLAPFFYTTTDGKKKQMTTRNLERIVDSYAEKTREVLYGIYGEKAKAMFPSDVTPHTLRRTRATLLLRDNVPLENISAFLGHANIETTRKYYAFLSDQQKKELARKRSKVIPKAEDDKNNDINGKLWNEGDELDSLFEF